MLNGQLPSNTHQSDTLQDEMLDIATESWKYRPLYHYTPLKNWMNDPNGMVYFDGEFHLCYQHDNYDAILGFWGHSRLM